MSSSACPAGRPFQASSSPPWIATQRPDAKQSSVRIQDPRSQENWARATLSPLGPVEIEHIVKHLRLDALHAQWAEAESVRAESVRLRREATIAAKIGNISDFEFNLILVFL